jgi:hypothetical protein
MKQASGAIFSIELISGLDAERIMIQRIGAGLLVFCWAAHFSTDVAPAQETTNASALARQLLTDVWDNSPQNRTDAQSLWDAASAEARSDPSAQWAFALNRINHRRFRDAKPFADQAAQANPSNWDVRYAQIWLTTFVKQFDQALEQMKKVKSDMDASVDLQPAQIEEFYFRLGRMIGYMEGPHGGRVQQTALDATLAALHEGADDQSFTAFTNERNSVISQWQSLMGEKDFKQQQAFDELVRKNETEFQQQSELAARMQQQSAEAQASRDTLVREGQAEVDKARSNLDGLTAEWNRQQSLIVSARYDLDGLWLSVANIDHLLAHESDPLIRSQLYLDRSYYLSLIRDKEFYLSTLQANANSVYSQLGSATAAYDQTVATYQGRVQDVDNQIATAESTIASANRKIRRLQAQPRVPNALVGTIQATAAALTNYDPFPTELLRQRALDAQ